MAALVLAERKRRAEDALESELLRGLDSGPSVAMDEEWWRRFNNREAERR